MKRPIEIAVISGKGGTGKTVFTSSLAKLIESKVVADCDVDTPNMHLLLNPRVKSEHVFFGDKIAILDTDKCTHCGECFRACRFGAVRERDTPEGWRYSINSLPCEGCAVCTAVCPEGAIRMAESSAGAWYLSDSEFGPFVHATLTAAQKNSDELVRIVRREARRVGVHKGLRFVIIDGPAGIGSPVIATIIGVSLAVVITEPSVSGMYDLRRVLDLTKHLGIRTAAIINKHDINSRVAIEIEDYLATLDTVLLGKIPFSSGVSEAIAGGRFAIDAPDDPAAEETKRIASKLVGSFAVEQ